jgi:uncharacterized protein (TIGR00255 family)
MATNPLRSMTGYGESEGDFEGGRLRVEIRTVNHRGLNLRLRLPAGFDRYQRGLDLLAREQFPRGQVTLAATFERRVELARAIRVDLDRAREYVEALRVLGTELGVKGEVDLATLARFRDLFQGVEREEEALLPTEEEFLGVAKEAMLSALAMRAEEGERLSGDLRRGLSIMERELEEIARRAPERIVAERDRLRLAIQALLEGETRVDEERLAREVAHLAERWDIHEEIVRFRSHLAMFRDTLDRGEAGGVGKRLGFIAQEFLREANTMGSKANDAAIAACVILLKEEIDRLREQLENVE